MNANTDSRQLAIGAIICKDQRQNLASPQSLYIYPLFIISFFLFIIRIEQQLKNSVRVYIIAPPPSRFIFGLKRVPFVFSYNRNNNSLDQMLPKSDFVLSRVFDCLPTAQTKKKQNCILQPEKKKKKNQQPCVTILQCMISFKKIKCASLVSRQPEKKVTFTPNSPLCVQILGDSMLCIHPFNFAPFLPHARFYFPFWTVIDVFLCYCYLAVSQIASCFF